MKGKKDLAKLTKKTITDKNGITRTVWVKLDKDTKVDKPKKKKEEKIEKTKEKIDYQPIFDWMDKAQAGDTISFRSAINRLNDTDKLHEDASLAYLKAKGITPPKDKSKLALYQKLKGIAREEAQTLYEKGVVYVLTRGIQDRKGGVKAFIEKYGEEVESLLFSDAPAQNLVALQKIKEMTPTIQDFPKKVGTEYLASIIVNMKLPEINTKSKGNQPVDLLNAEISKINKGKIDKIVEEGLISEGVHLKELDSSVDSYLGTSDWKKQYKPSPQVKKEIEILKNKGLIEAIRYDIKQSPLSERDINSSFGKDFVSKINSDDPMEVYDAIEDMYNSIDTRVEAETIIGSKVLVQAIMDMKLPDKWKFKDSLEKSKNDTKKTQKSEKSSESTSPNKPYRSTPTEDLVTLAKDNGLSWKESSDPRINRMRVIMALKAESILPDSSQKTKTKKSKKDETKYQTKAKEKPKTEAKKSETKKSKYSSVEDLRRAINSKNNMDRLIDEGYKDYYKWDTGEDPDEDYDDDGWDDDENDDDDDGYYGNSYDNWIPPKMIQQEAEYIKDFGIVEAINVSIKEDNLDGEDIDYDDPAHGEQVIKDLKSDDPDKVLEALKYIKSTVDDLPFGSALMASVIENMKLPE